MREIQGTARGQERDRAAEREADHAQPCRIGATGEPPVGQHGVQRLAHMARPLDEGPGRAWMERGDDDEALAREMQEQQAMDQGRTRPATIAMREQDDGKSVARRGPRDRGVRAGGQRERSDRDRRLVGLCRIGDESFERRRVLDRKPGDAGAERLGLGARRQRRDQRQRIQ